MRSICVFLIIFTTVAAFGQSGRITAAPASDQVSPGNGDPALTVKQMFDEANDYIKKKAAENDAKKISFSEKLFDQARLEQRQLAAKYAATVGVRKDLAGDDLYYLGMLHWIAENLDGTVENLRKYVVIDATMPDRRQRARSILVVALAKQNKLSDAETVLSDYLKSEPATPAERARMEGEMAKAYQAQKDFARMAPHADEDYKAAKAAAKDASSRTTALQEIFDAGSLVFEANRDLGNQKNAEAALEDLRSIAAAAASADLYYYVVDQKIKYLIETGRKAAAQEYYMTSLVRAESAFGVAALRADVVSRLKKRERHYRLLGEPAPELPMIDQWFPGERKTFADLKGKVILLDFWATWCGPCYETFPLLKEWQQDFSRDGLVILGVTKYYGMVNGQPATEPAEIEELKRFRERQQLPYDLLVAKDSSSQLLYGGTALPTTVLIDKKGIIRYLESGTSKMRLVQIRAMIEKLLAEK